MSKNIGFIVVILLLIQCSEAEWDRPANEPVHITTWINTQYLNTADFHGTVAMEQGTEVCESCHGEDLNGKEGVSGCYRCHFGPDGSRVPEDAVWLHSQTRHQEFESDREVCNACHDLERSFGTGPVVCHNCHGDGTQHVLGQPWLDRKSPDFHGTADVEACANCHDTEDKCNECHFGETGSKSPPGTGWVHSGDGDDESHREYESYITTCNQCHKISRTYANGPESCHNCHDTEDD